MPTKPTAIITSDIGLQEGQPVCRLDNYWEAQECKVQWLQDLQANYEVPIFDGGDLFEHWKPSPYLLRWAIEHLPDDMITVPGNHDLPAHSIELYYKSGLSVLEEAGKVQVLRYGDVSGMPYGGDVLLHGFPWGSELKPLPDVYREKQVKNVAILHAMCYIGKTPWPGCKDWVALDLLKFMDGYDLVIVGHNHQPFIVEHKGRKLISPGSLTRTTADQMDYKPHVYLWYAETNQIKPIAVPIKKGVVSREHLATVERRDERMIEFVSRMEGGYEVTLSYENNLRRRMAQAKVRKAVQNIIWEAVDGIKRT